MTSCLNCVCDSVCNKKYFVKTATFECSTFIDKESIAYLQELGLTSPPCKIGETVYFYNAGDIVEGKISRVVFDTEAVYFVGSHKFFRNEDFGVKVFKDKSEAERMLL